MGKKKIIPRVDMPRQSPLERIKNFNEVALGYTEEMAKLEASRCLMCPKPLCIKGCPVEIDIPAFIQLIKEGDYIGAVKKIKETNCLPAICGRVCPQEDQCEKYCVLSKKHEPVAIGRLERFVADFERENNLIEIPEVAPPTGKKVAVVGSGPSGLTVAGDLIQLGHQVTIFEALHEPGGVLTYGIPEFRLPKSIVRAEIDYLKKLGVEIKVNHIIGKTITIDDLFDMGYNAVFIGAGAGLPRFMNIPGENYNGVYSANEYLTRVNLMKAYKFPEYDTPIKKAKRVAVIGAGNVSMDSARTALRLGAEEVILVYRRSRLEMPAREEEIENAEAEGVKFMFLTNPIRILGDHRGWVKGMLCVKMELGEPDESGRRRPIPIPGSEFELEVDQVIMAIGQTPNPVISQYTPDLKVSRWNNIITDGKFGRTSKKGVWAGGDIVTGSATVILAMGAGRVAARDIHNYLMNGEKDWEF